MRHGPGLHTGGMARQIASFEAAFKSQRKIADDTYEFTFEKPAGLEFRAGQHVRMTLINPTETDPEGNSRFFTIVSTPQEPELKFAWRVRDTAFKRVVGRMQPGEKVTLQRLIGESPHGSFVLPEEADKAAVFIVGGIGIVPAYSMIKDATERNLPHELFLFYSNRRPEDAPYLAELQTLATQNSKFKLIATMTGPEKSDEKTWQGETGVINRVLLEKYISNLKAPNYYAAWLPEMVSAMKAMLADAGVPEKNVRAEEFTGFSLNQLHSSSNRAGKNYVLIGVIALGVLALLAVHIGMLGPLSHSRLLSTFSLNNPVSYLIILALLAMITFKIYVIINVKRALHPSHPGQKVSDRDIVKAHNPIKKR